MTVSGECKYFSTHRILNLKYTVLQHWRAVFARICKTQAGLPWVVWIRRLRGRKHLLSCESGKNTFSNMNKSKLKWKAKPHRWRLLNCTWAC